MKAVVPQGFVTGKHGEQALTEYENVYYLKAIEDQVIPASVQDIMIKYTEEVIGKKVFVTEVQRGHSVMYFPETVDFVLENAGLNT
jgi:hypothetical protein